METPDKTETLLPTVQESSLTVMPLPLTTSDIIASPLTNPLPLTTTQVSYNNIDLLYNKIILNSPLLIAVHNLKTTGFTNATIPQLILTMIATYNSYTTSTPAHRLTSDDLQVLLERVYNYLVEKYDLVNTPDRLAMYNLFDISLTLCLAIPNVKKEVNSCLNFFKCAGRK